jgi:hypothetical protein
MKIVRTLMTTAMVLGATILVLSPEASSAGGRAHLVTTPTTIHGVNFQIKTQFDTNFCIRVESGTTEGRTLTLQQCAAIDDAERWAFSLQVDDTNQILDSQGMCLDGRYRRANDGLPLPVAKCQSGPAWRFVYLGTGLIQNVKNGKCLFVAGAAANAPVWLKDCDTSFDGQRWLVTH